jgi:CRP-like cAMP-binding protein
MLMKKTGNHLLDALEADCMQRLQGVLEPVNVSLKQIICEAGSNLDHAYFPQGAVLSLLTLMEDGTTIETANIGREGAFGIFSAMYSRVSFNRCIVQLEGPMLRCPCMVIEKEFERSSHTRNLFVSYSETLLSQIQQTVGCNALHTVGERMCRWLLMMDDRAEGQPMPYTQEFLAEMMAVNRTSISLAAQAMQDKGIIDYSRGKIKILDRPALEEASCECYQVVKKRFDAFFDTPSGEAESSAAKSHRNSVGRKSR